MATAKKPVPWNLIFILGFLVVALIFLLKFCGGGGGRVIVPTGKSDSAIIDQRARQEQYTKDSAAWAEQRNEMDIRILAALENQGMLTIQLLKSERTIKELAGKILNPSVTINPDAYPDTCRDLAIEALKLTKLNEDNRIAQLEIDRQTAIAKRLLDSARIACERERLAGIGNFNILRETYEKLKAENRKSTAALYGGLSGIYNPLVQGVGPTVLFKTNRDQLIGGSFYITNNRPAYEIRGLIKISLRKK